MRGITLASRSAAVVVSLSLGLSTGLMAQVQTGEQQVDSPVLGYWIGAGPQLRAMLGIPGAARLSDPLPVPDGTTAVDMASGGAWVLVQRATDCLALNPALNQMAAIANFAPASWAYSPSGTWLALYDAGSGQIRTYSGLPAAPKPEASLAAPAFDQLAISDAGAVVFAAGGSLTDKSGALLYQSNAPLGPIAFAVARQQLYAFDAASGGLMELSNAPRVVAAGFGKPDALYVSDRAYAGDSASGVLWAVDLASGSATAITVPVSRITGARLGGAVFVSLRGDSPVWLLNGSNLSFVPALAGGGQ